MASNVSDGSYVISLCLSDGRDIRLMVDEATYNKVCEEDESTLQSLMSSCTESDVAQINTGARISPTPNPSPSPTLTTLPPRPTTLTTLPPRSTTLTTLPPRPTTLTTLPPRSTTLPPRSTLTTRPTLTPSPNPSPSASPSQSPTPSQTNITRHEWTVHEIKTLLKLINDNKEKLKSFRNKNPIWREISSELKITPEKCQDKYKYLKKMYKNYVQLNNKTGASPAHFDYADEMAEIMGDDPSVKPTFTASSDATTLDNLETDDESTTVNDLPSTSKPKTKSSEKKRKRSSETLINYLEERDEKLKKVMLEMHKDTMNAMDRLIDKF